MITRIEVDGFKTLSQFVLDFQPGLNVLVGPNGAGKTNIVSFFELLTHLMSSDASEAVSQVGGAGAVFRRVEKNDYERTITVRILGCVEAMGDRHQRKKKENVPRFIAYEYGFTLLFPESRDAVLFSMQHFKAFRTLAFVRSADIVETTTEWGFDVASSLDSEGVPKGRVHRVEDEFIEIPMFSPAVSPTEKRDQIGAFFTSMLVDNVSLISVITRLSPDLWLIAQDIKAGRVYNIVPSRIKLPEDSAKPPGIARDGSGLSATLYAVQRSKELLESDHWYYMRPRRRKDIGASLDQIRAYLRVVNSAIEDINVVNDPFDNQLRVRFTICSGNYRAAIPLALMSDGTLKWVALVTAALTARSVFSIEEPENYLHPQMQAQIVGILREILFREEAYRMTLMTTHSETLLNQCRPEELIIVSMENGRTVAVRCTDPNEIAEEIRRTGFGLGYYYVSNALQD